MKTIWIVNIVMMFFIIGSLGIACQSETSKNEHILDTNVQNLETFARLYGYARWFHPSEEAQLIDWDKFVVLGVQKVMSNFKQI